MRDIYAEIVNALEAGDRLAMATIIRRVGSAPREAGAKYLIKGDGTSIGSIGGGCVEADVWQEAQKVIAKQEGKVLHFKLTTEQLAEGGLICGGNIDIFLEPLRESYTPIYQEVSRVRRRGGSGILATVISIDETTPGRGDVKTFIKASGEKTGSLLAGEGVEERVSQEVRRLLKTRKLEVLSVSPRREEQAWKNAEILLEPICCEPTVFIFGAGHISQQLAPLVKKVHFNVVVIDDREIFANRALFPEADEVIVSEFEKSFDQISIDDSSYIVIVTRGHLYDGLILGKAVETNARYIGMIGSKKKIQTLYRNLLDQGIPRASLDRVHAPIGLDIHSETPEEIAVSIVAELIQERRG